MEKTVYEQLKDAYAQAEIPLLEREARNDERRGRREAIKEEAAQIEAKKDLLSHTMTEWRAVGDIGQWQRCQGEMNELTATHNLLDAEYDTLGAEVIREAEALEGARKELAKRVVKQAFPAIREQALAKIKEVTDYLDGLWADMIRYEAETGKCLLVTAHRDWLAPQRFVDSNEEKQLYSRVRGWFGPTMK